MDTMLDVLSWFAEDEEGAAAIEYGLIASLVSVAAVAALGLMGASLEQLLNLAVEAMRPPEIGRASCREKCRSRWSPYH